jgi:hypothetical protein
MLNGVAFIKSSGGIENGSFFAALSTSPAQDFFPAVASEEIKADGQQPKYQTLSSNERIFQISELGHHSNFVQSQTTTE